MKTEFGGRRCKGGRFNQGGFSMYNPDCAILGGDPFSDIFRGLYDPKCFWRLTDPDYCLAVMQGAYDGGCRAFDYSFPAVQEIFLRLQDRVDEEITGYGNPTYLQGVKLDGRPLQYCRDRVLKTIVEDFFEPRLARMIKDDLRHNACMVFGYDEAAEKLGDKEIKGLYLDEAAFTKRLRELDACKYVMIGGTDADWLFSLQRPDLIQEMAALVRANGKIPLLICHYASTVLPEAERIKLDVEGYFVPINKQWSWFSKEETVEAIKVCTKPVIAFMAFASGGLKQDLPGALAYLKNEAGVSGVLYGTSKPENARKTAELIIEMYKG